MNRLRALFVAAGLLTAGGTVFTIALLRPDATVADAVDAGLLQVSDPARVSCRVRIVDECRGLDGGSPLPQYARFGMRARKSKPAAPIDFVLLDVPDRWKECIRLAGTPTEACDIVESGACTDSTICAANADPRAEQNLCACRKAAGICRLSDGGTAPFGVTLEPGWNGAGCQRKYCGPELAGEQGGSWPANCP